MLIYQRRSSRKNSCEWFNLFPYGLYMWIDKKKKTYKTDSNAVPALLLITRSMTSSQKYERFWKPKSSMGMVAQSLSFFQLFRITGLPRVQSRWELGHRGPALTGLFAALVLQISGQHNSCWSLRNMNILSSSFTWLSLARLSLGSWLNINCMF